MNEFIIIITSILILINLQGLILLFSSMFFNGDISGYTPCQMLTDEEIELLSSRYAKEKFTREVYLLTGALIRHDVTMRTARGGYGSFSYDTINGIKVQQNIMASDETDKWFQLGEQGVYKVVKGKRKFYIISANGKDLIAYDKETRQWLNAWFNANNNDNTAARDIRILGQRRPTRQEQMAFQSYIESFGIPSRSLGCLLLFFALGALLLIFAFPAVSFLKIIFFLLALAVIFCLFIQPYYYPRKLGVINIIEGVMRLSTTDRRLYVGQLNFYIRLDDMLKEIQQSPQLGKLCAVEVTVLDNELINIEAISSFVGAWQKQPPFKDSTYLGILGGLLLGTSIGLISQLDFYNTSWLAIEWFYASLALIFIPCAILSLFFFIRNRLFYNTKYHSY